MALGPMGYEEGYSSDEYAPSTYGYNNYKWTVERYNGIVTLHGNILNDTTPVLQSVTLFNLPSNYRPKTTCQLYGMDGNTGQRYYLTISTNGNVSIFIYGSAAVVRCNSTITYIAGS